MDTKIIDTRVFTLDEQTVMPGNGLEITLGEQTITLGAQEVTLDQKTLTLGRRMVTLGERTAIIDNAQSIKLRSRKVILSEQKIPLDGPKSVMAVISEQKILDEQAITRGNQKIVTLDGAGLILSGQTVRLDNFSVNASTTWTVTLSEQTVTLLGGLRTTRLDDFGAFILGGGNLTITLDKQEFKLTARP